MIFEEKSLSRYISLSHYNWPNLLAWLPLLLEILGNMCIVIIRCPVCDVINFENNISFLNKPFFDIIKSQDKNVYISRMKKAFKVGLLPFKKNWLHQWKQFKNGEKGFLFHLKSFSFSRYFNFCLEFLVM